MDQQTYEDSAAAAASSAMFEEGGSAVLFEAGAMEDSFEAGATDDPFADAAGTPVDIYTDDSQTSTIEIMSDRPVGTGLPRSFASSMLERCDDVDDQSLLGSEFRRDEETPLTTVLSFGSSEEVLALVEDQSIHDKSLVQQVTTSATPDVSELAFSDEVLQQLLAMLIKPEQPVISQPVQLPVIAETPGTTNPEPPIKPCPNVLQTRSYPQSAGTLSIFTTPQVNSATSKITAGASSDAAESRSWDSLLHLLMGNSTSESRRNSTGSLKGQSTSGFRVPQACDVLCIGLLLLLLCFSYCLLFVCMSVVLSLQK